MSHSTSKILCNIDANTIHGIPNLLDSFPDNGESVNESVLVEVYKGCKTEVRCEFLSSILNEGQSLEGLFLPYKYSHFQRRSAIGCVFGLPNFRYRQRHSCQRSCLGFFIENEFSQS